MDRPKPHKNILNLFCETWVTTVSVIERKVCVCVCVCVCECERVCVWQRNESTAWHTLSLQKPKTDVFVSSFPSFINQTILILELSAPSSSSLNKALKHTYARTHTIHTHTHTHTHTQHWRGCCTPPPAPSFPARPRHSSPLPASVHPPSFNLYISDVSQRSLFPPFPSSVFTALSLFYGHMSPLHSSPLLSHPFLSFPFLTCPPVLQSSPSSLPFPFLSSHPSLLCVLILPSSISSPLLSSPLLSWTAFLTLPADCCLLLSLSFVWLAFVYLAFSHL